MEKTAHLYQETHTRSSSRSATENWISGQNEFMFENREGERKERRDLLRHMVRSTSLYAGEKVMTEDMERGCRRLTVRGEIRLEQFSKKNLAT